MCNAKNIAPWVVSFFAAIAASPAPAAAAELAGSDTRGGLVEGTRIVRVTSLDDDGAGSLRQALRESGPRVIVFNVSGVITLASDLSIRVPNVTIAGQTAPEPGIALTGAALRVRTHDVVIQHIAVRPGIASTPKLNDNRDGISIDGQGPNASYSVRIENVSVSWSVDEAINSWYPTTRAITIRNSIVAEALRDAGHPKGSHSMGLLVGKETKGVEITGNLLASNAFRNPGIGAGASAFIGNNYIVNPGMNSIHVYSHDGSRTVSRIPTRITIVGNVVEAGPDSGKRMTAVQLPRDMATLSPNARIFIGHNLLKGRDASPLVSNRSGLPLLTEPEVATLDWTLLPTEAVEAYVTRYAGTRPAERNPVDARLFAEIANGRERIIDRPNEMAGTPPQAGGASPSAVPDDPLSLASAGMSRLEAWLCLRHFAVGGPATRQCPDHVMALQDRL